MLKTIQILVHRANLAEGRAMNDHSEQRTHSMMLAAQYRGAVDALRECVRDAEELTGNQLLQVESFLPLLVGGGENKTTQAQSVRRRLLKGAPKDSEIVKEALTHNSVQYWMERGAQ